MELTEAGSILDTCTSRIRDLDKAGPLCTTAVAAEMLGVTPTILRFWQLRGRGPRFLSIRIQSRDVLLYSLADLQEFALAEVRDRRLLRLKRGDRS